MFYIVAAFVAITLSVMASTCFVLSAWCAGFAAASVLR